MEKDDTPRGQRGATDGAARDRVPTARPESTLAELGLGSATIGRPPDSLTELWQALSRLPEEDMRLLVQRAVPGAPRDVRRAVRDLWWDALEFGRSVGQSAATNPRMRDRLPAVLQRAGDIFAERLLHAAAVATVPRLVRAAGRLYNASDPETPAAIVRQLGIAALWPSLDDAAGAAHLRAEVRNHIEGWRATAARGDGDARRQLRRVARVVADVLAGVGPRPPGRPPRDHPTRVHAAYLGQLLRVGAAEAFKTGGATTDVVAAATGVPRSTLERWWRLPLRRQRRSPAKAVARDEVAATLGMSRRRVDDVLAGLPIAPEPVRSKSP